MPRSVNWTPELVDAIVVDITAGCSIASICGSDTFPHHESTFWRHFAQDADFASVITRAMETRSDRDVDQCRNIALQADADNWQVAQLQIRTLQWEAGKRRPKKYGDKVQTELSGADGGPIQTQQVTVQFVPPGAARGSGDNCPR